MHFRARDLGPWVFSPFLYGNCGSISSAASHLQHRCFCLPLPMALAQVGPRCLKFHSSIALDSATSLPMVPAPCSPDSMRVSSPTNPTQSHSFNSKQPKSTRYASTKTHSFNSNEPKLACCKSTQSHSFNSKQPKSTRKASTQSHSSQRNQTERI